MNNETIQALNVLAAKLGTTTEYLWGVLIKQAPISGVLDILLMFVWIIATVWWFRFVKVKTTKPQETVQDMYPSASWEEEGAIVAWVSVFITGIVGLCIIVCALGGITTAFLNPEYWALKQILH